MKIHGIRLFALALLFGASGLAQSQPDQKSGWIQLFNGNNLDGWTPKITGYEPGENFGNTFRVENGVIRVSYDQYDTFGDRFGHLFYNQSFSSYRLVVEYRFLDGQMAGGPSWARRNSGIMIHSQSPQSMRKDQNFPISIEVQLLGGEGAETRPTLNLCTPGTNVVMNGELVTRHCTNSTSKTYYGDQWVRVEVEVNGGKHIRHIVDGQTVIEYDAPQIGGGSVANFDPAVKQDGKLLTEGYICLQSESHPVEFRKVELLPLEE